MRNLALSIYNKEALSSTSSSDLIDPISISLSIKDSNNLVIQKVVPVRMSQGRYIATVDDSLFFANERYNAIWTYELHADMLQVLTKSFVWNPTPAVIAGMCWLYDYETNLGFPVESCEITFAHITNVSGSNHHFTAGSFKIVSDAFGYWGMFMPYNSVINVTVQATNKRKTVRVPSTPTAEFDSLANYQTIIATDSFGNLV